MTAIQVAISLAAVSLLTRPPLAELRHLAGRWRWVARRWRICDFSAPMPAHAAIGAP